jgi:hypothetical protein
LFFFCFLNCRRPEAYSHDVELQAGEDEASRGEVLDFYGHTEAAVMAFARERLPCLAHADSVAVAAPPAAAAAADPANKDEILELVKSGPPGNRIDLVFMVLAHDTTRATRHTRTARTTRDTRHTLRLLIGRPRDRATATLSRSGSGSWGT